MRRLYSAGLVAPALTALLATNLLSTAQGAAIPTSLGSGADSMLARDDSTGAGGPYSGDNMLGGGTSMQIRSGDATNRNRLGIVRFDISSVASVTTAGANIQFTETGNNGRAITVYGLNDGDAGENWDEASITYNTAPGISFNNSMAPALSTDFDPARTTNLGTFNTTSSTNEVVTFSGAALEAFIAADTNDLLTFYLYQNNLNGAIGITTKEGGAAPVLTLVPEPATALLGGLAGLVLVGARRRWRLA
jgi:hypothetical protein